MQNGTHYTLMHIGSPRYKKLFHNGTHWITLVQIGELVHNVMVHIGSQWHTLVHIGSQRYTLVHIGELVHIGTHWWHRWWVPQAIESLLLQLVGTLGRVQN